MSSHAERPAEGLFVRLQRRLFRPCDGASLAVFRMAVGAILLWECWRYYSKNWILAFFIHPPYHSTYYGFDWVTPWAGDGMYWHFGAMAVAAVGILTGTLSRLSAAAYGVLFGYVFLIEKARHLNHHYLVIVMCFLLAASPAGRVWSVDAWFTRLWRAGPYGKPPAEDDLPPGTVPAWGVWLFRIQIALVYFFAALAKLTPDWLRGLPLVNMLGKAADVPLLGQFHQEPWLALLFAWAGLAIDLVAAPAMLSRRFRLPMACALLGFHLANSHLWNIGIFPWFMIATTPIFFPEDWPRRLVVGPLAFLAGLLGLRRLRAWLEGPLRSPAPPLEATGTTAPEPPRAPPSHAPWTLALLGAWVTFQVLTPLRHWLIPGNPEWHEVGHRFSWRMKLRSRMGAVVFFVRDKATNKRWRFYPIENLPIWQARKIAREPDQIWQVAQYLEALMESRGAKDVEVRAVAYSSLNRRKCQLLVDPFVDLASAPRGGLLSVPSWVLPLSEAPPALGARHPYGPWHFLRRWGYAQLFDGVPVDLPADDEGESMEHEPPRSSKREDSERDPDADHDD